MLKDDSPKFQHATKFAALASDEYDFVDIPEVVVAEKAINTGIRKLTVQSYRNVNESVNNN